MDISDPLYSLAKTFVRLVTNINPLGPLWGSVVKPNGLSGRPQPKNFFGEDREWGLPEASDTYGQRGSQTKPVLD